MCCGTQRLCIHNGVWVVWRPQVRIFGIEAGPADPGSTRVVSYWCLTCPIGAWIIARASNISTTAATDAAFQMILALVTVEESACPFFSTKL